MFIQTRLFLFCRFLGLIIFSLLLICQPVIAQTIIRDNEIETILNEWFNPIFRANGMDPDQVNIILVQSNEINAFVAGGANIFIYTGLIQKTETPIELVGVMAHELGHISGGHAVRGRDAMEQASYESILGTLVGIGAAIASGDPGAAAAISGGSNSMAERRYLSTSRTFEASADQAAIHSLEKAKINPTGLLTFLQKLEGQELVPASQQSEYVLTHPLTRTRIESVTNAIEKSAYKDAGFPASWSEQHQRVKAKLLGFINPEQVIWTYTEQDVSLPAQYAHAIADYRQNKIDKALIKIDALIAKEPNNPYFYELKGQMLFEFNRIQDSLIPYKKALELSPESALIRIALAHALLESPLQSNQTIEEAIGHLKRALIKEPRSTEIHRFLATAYGHLGQESEAKLHLAEEAQLKRNIPYAKQQAEEALKGLKEGSPSWYRAKDILVYNQE